MFGSPWSFAFAIAGTVVAVGILLMPLALIVVSTIVRQRRSPASSVTWLITILLLPLIGIPLFWLFGNRKIKRIARDKPRVELTAAQQQVAPTASREAVVQAAAHLGSSAITRGNALKFHEGGEDAFADLLTLIDGAKRSIHIQTYVLSADATGRAIVERLIARAKEGLEVRFHEATYAPDHNRGMAEGRWDMSLSAADTMIARTTGCIASGRRSMNSRIAA